MSPFEDEMQPVSDAMPEEGGVDCETDAGGPDNVDAEQAEAEADASQSNVESALLARLDGIETALADLTGLFCAKIDRSEYELETLRKQSDEIQEYRADLYGKLTTPLLQDVVQIHAGMMKTMERFAAAEDEQGGFMPVDTFGIYCEQLEDLLADNGIERFSVAPGDAFVSGDMRIIGKVPASDEELVGTVAEAAGDGYRRNGKPLSPARVKVYVSS